ncbi:amino acid/polyamine transporter I [Ilyonectria robusta]|uniref:amino acid/polyamine transporter I n=1 Tax=Ilyonectria robusta TaxID=1079257 RepID=UPI001E8ECC83|nr:amino acid/polyamine transporter I [Ilyonectria robusta]KAH8649575.1 amino acid/polyamine transporter I [Ilyonectria robusta]
MKNEHITDCNDLHAVNTISGGFVVESEHSSAPERPRKQFSLVSLAGIGLVVGNTWPALGGAIGTSIFNGAAPGVLYEFIAVSLCYFCVAATLAELASALPSSSGVYLWASFTPGNRCGRVVGYFAGWWNCLAWVFAEASMSMICSNLCVQMYAYQHPGFVQQLWHVFVCFLLITWLACAIVCLAQFFIARLNIVGLVLILLGALVTIIICAAMVTNGPGPGPASSATVWRGWSANIRYPDAITFLAGMLNASFALGTPDAVSHLAEEIPHPETNVPKAVAMQYILGFVSGFSYLITIMYCITDYDAIAGSAFPIAEVYNQATGHYAGGAATLALLALLLLPTFGCTIGCYVTCGRTLWVLARDGATPFPSHLGHIDAGRGMPLAATLTSAVVVSVLGIISLGSVTAFNAFVGSYILLSTSSYLAAAVPYVLYSRRVRSNDKGQVERGPFFMHGIIGWVVCSWACIYMSVWFVVYCLPYSLPTVAQDMNYTSLIWGGMTLIVTAWWFIEARHKCVRPKRVLAYIE